MRLYHGTTGKRASRAVVEGIKPRDLTGHSNWDHTSPSHGGAVYLTDAYPLYFAIQALTDDEIVAAVVEIETDRINTQLLAPDEDVLEQMWRGKDNLPGGMHARTAHYRDRLDEYEGVWEHSLKAMGTCCYLGTVPAEAITRVCYVDIKQQRALAINSMQASITLANYRYCREDYVNLTRQAFGDTTEPSDRERIMKELATKMGVDLSPTVPADRMGLVVVDLEKAAA